MTWTVERHVAVGSTQQAAKERARAGAPDGTVIVAGEQTEGHGQHGRAWHSPAGGLYLSVVLRGLDDPRLLTLALGNAVADVLEVAGAEPRLKWVNDVLIGGRKVAGILCEGESTADRIDYIAAGLGLNVNGHAADFPSPLNRQATTVEDELGVEACGEDLESFLLESMERWVERVRAGDKVAVLDAWRARDALRGRRVGLDPDGDLCAKVIGTAEGIDDEGRLLVRVDDQVAVFAAARVFVD